MRRGTVLLPDRVRFQGYVIFLDDRIHLTVYYTIWKKL